MASVVVLVAEHAASRLMPPEHALNAPEVSRERAHNSPCHVHRQTCFSWRGADVLMCHVVCCVTVCDLCVFGSEENSMIVHVHVHVHVQCAV